MNKEKELLKALLTNWLKEIDKDFPQQTEIIAINFNLAEPYQIDIMGSSVYDAYDDDWACDDELNIHSFLALDSFFKSSTQWEQVLETVFSILKELSKKLDLKLFKIEHITIGFVDGDLEIIK